jgi:hypothetical protein
MLWKVDYGEWVLKWDADELPSDGMMQTLRPYIENRQDRGGFTVPCYHIMKEPRMCLPIEVGWGHMCLFKMTQGMRYAGRVHEQINAMGRIGTIVPGSGIAIIHFSYFAEKRFKEKAQKYAVLPGAGFANAAQLTSRLSLKTVPLPDYVTYTADWDWLMKVKES